MNAKVVFRVDGGSRLGLGHLIRCSAVAQMIQNEFQLSFICREIPPEIRNDFEKMGFDVQMIDLEEEFFSLISGNDIIVLDGYDFDSYFQKRLKNFGVQLVCIDDLHDKEFYADLIINHAPGITSSDYRAQPYTKFGLGTNYVMLRPQFLQGKRKQVTQVFIENILICFGGADPENLTVNTLDVVYSLNLFKNIVIVTGASYMHKSELENSLASKNNVIHYHSISGEEIHSLMEDSDLGIVPASGIVYEMIALNKIVITGMYIRNQSIFLRELAKLTGVVNCEDFSESNIVSAIRQVLNNSPVPMNVFDGQSGERILKLFRSLRKRIYIVTGAAGGLGKALVELIMEKGYHVLSLSRSITEKQKNLTETGSLLQFIEHDFFTEIPQQKLNLIKNLLIIYKEVFFINNAGTIQPIRAFKELNMEEINQNIMVNVHTPMSLILFLLNELTTSKLTFVNISSGAASRSIANWSLYGASKAFMLRLFETLAEENKDGSDNRFISLDPGMIDTKMQEYIRSSDFPSHDAFAKAKEAKALLSPMEAAARIFRFFDK